jgi:hypothetical protein
MSEVEIRALIVHYGHQMAASSIPGAMQLSKLDLERLLDRLQELVGMLP